MEDALFCTNDKDINLMYDEKCNRNGNANNVTMVTHVNHYHDYACPWISMKMINMLCIIMFLDCLKGW